jgi:hypothetical protein
LCIRCGQLLVENKTSLLDQYGPKQAAEKKIREISCSGCSKKIELDEKTLLARIAAGDISCVGCGSKLVIPSHLQDALRSARAKTPIRTTCCCCGRVVRTDVQSGMFACTFCGLRFTIDGDRPQLIDQREILRANEEELEPALAAIPNRAPFQVVRAALLGRARSLELLPGEAEAMIETLLALERWRPSAVAIELPIKREDVEGVLSPLLFRAPHYRWSGDAAMRGIFAYPLPPGMSSVDARFLAMNAIGLGLLAATGTGFVETPGGDDNVAHRTYRVMVAVAPSPRGVKLQFSSQNTDQPEKLFAPDQERAIAKAIDERRDQLTAYFVLLSIFGRAAAGLPLIAATPENIARRLTTLDPALASHAKELAVRLRFTHRPAAFLDLRS